MEKTCTWKDESQCHGCNNEGVLNCRWKAGHLFTFYAVILPVMLGALVGAVLIGVTQGAWWPLIAYILFFPIVLGIAELRFLCCHCPYYAEEGRILHCLANHGLLKIWRYHPEPMNRLEKRLMIALGAIFSLMSVVIHGFNIVYFSLNAGRDTELIMSICLALLTIASLVTMATVMIKFICSACVNFSCPFNRVDKKHVDAYLLKNPVMKKAWEENGYQLEDSGYMNT